MATTSQSDNTTQGIDFSTFTALHVGVGQMALSGKLAANEVANISFGIDANSQYHFMKEVYYTDRVHPVGLWTPLSVEEMRAILTALKEKEKHVSPGLDPVLLRTFIHLLSQAIENQPSMRFNDPTFGSIAIVRRSLIVGHFELGPDVAGMIHDAHGVVTVEQHVVAMPPGRFRHLSNADRLSLVAALEKFTTTAQPPADPLWGQVLSDLKK